MSFGLTELIEELDTLKQYSSNSAPLLNGQVQKLIRVLEQGKPSTTSTSGIDNLRSAITELNVFSKWIDVEDNVQNRSQSSDESGNFTLQYFADTDKTSPFSKFMRAFEHEVKILGPIVDPSLERGILSIDLSGADIDTTAAESNGDVGSYNLGPQDLRSGNAKLRLRGAALSGNVGKQIRDSASHGIPEGAGRDAFKFRYNPLHGAEPSLKEQIIRWSRCSTSYKHIRDEAYSCRNPNIGKRFFESPQYIEWVNGEEKQSRNLSCVGKPGSGKTSTASAVIEDLIETHPLEQNAVFYAYFKGGSQSCQTIPIVFSNFLSQIVEGQEEPSQPIRDLYQEYGPLNAIPRLDKVKAILKSKINSCKRSYIVVDALDVFSLEDPISSSRLVAELEDLGARLLITSRYAVDFTPGTFSHIHIFADIIIFVRDQLALKNTRVGRLIKRSPNLEEEIIEKICEKCDGMFITARLLVESISRILTISQVRDVLKNLPNGFDAAYEFAINSQSEEFRTLSRRVMEWLVYSKGRMTITELLHAVSFEPEMETISEDDLVEEVDIISACTGLVLVSDGYVQFSHYSTQEFLQRNADRYFPNAKCHIAETCLRYLTHVLQSVDPLSDLSLSKHHFGFLTYATTH